MKKIYFPYIAVVLGLILMGIVIFGSTVGEDGARAVPLLSLLVINEFGFFSSIAGVYVGVQHLRATGFKLAYALATLLCIALTIQFTLLGMQLWPKA